MSFFTSGFFWFIEGIFTCLAVIGLKLWAEDRGIPMPFWKWIMVGAWVLLLGFTIAFVGTSLGENEPTAAKLGGILFGLTTIISGIAGWRIILSGRKSAE
jgi:drug/metabolite transporter (DMT)-like permease